MKWLPFVVLATLVGCAAAPARMTAAEGRALIAIYMPAGVPDKEGWAGDIYTPMSVRWGA